MIIYGLATTPIILGAKQDLCATCNVAGPHVILRRVRWAEIFWIPIAPLWINHRLVCANCGAETKLGFRQVRRALGSGNLPLPHRARFDEFAEALYNDNQRRPAEAEFDTVERTRSAAAGTCTCSPTPSCSSPWSGSWRSGRGPPRPRRRGPPTTAGSRPTGA